MRAPGLIDVASAAWKEYVFVLNSDAIAHKWFCQKTNRLLRPITPHKRPSIEGSSPSPASGFPPPCRLSRIWPFVGRVGLAASSGVDHSENGMPGPKIATNKTEAATAKRITGMRSEEHT